MQEIPTNNCSLVGAGTTVRSAKPEPAFCSTAGKLKRGAWECGGYAPLAIVRWRPRKSPECVISTVRQRRVVHVRSGTTLSARVARERNEVPFRSSTLHSGCAQGKGGPGVVQARCKSWERRRPTSSSAREALKGNREITSKTTLQPFNVWGSEDNCRAAVGGTVSSRLASPHDAGTPPRWCLHSGGAVHAAAVCGAAAGMGGAGVCAAASLPSRPGASPSPR